jgi:hypothetical protein
VCHTDVDSCNVQLGPHLSGITSKLTIVLLVHAIVATAIIFMHIISSNQFETKVNGSKIFSLSGGGPGTQVRMVSMPESSPV